MVHKCEMVQLQLYALVLALFTLGMTNIGFQSEVQAINDTDSKSIDMNNSTTSQRPTLTVDQNCAIASTIIPGSYNASGFPPNVHLGVVIRSENTTSTMVAEVTSPFTGLHNDITDSHGSIQGEFNIDTTRGPDKGYHLEIFVDNDRDDVPDADFEKVISPVGC